MSVPSKTSDRDYPTVAVIIPCHNHSEYVGKAMESVLDQDYPAKMLVVVNDNSTDDSWDKIMSFMDVESHQHGDEETDSIVVTGSWQNMPMIAVNGFETRKQAAARNTAIKLAWQNADLFCPLDADDLYLQGKLSKSVAVYQTSPKMIGLVYSDVIIHDPRNNTYVHELRQSYDRSILEVDNIISNAPLISKDALGYSGMYDEDLPPCEDWDLWLRITENFVALHIPEPLQQYTSHGANCTNTISTEIWNEKRDMIQQKMHQRKQLRYGSSQ